MPLVPIFLTFPPLAARIRLRMKALFFILAACAAVFCRAEDKDIFAGFYKGEIIGARGYPLGHAPDIYAEVYRGANKTYRLKILSDVMARADEHAVAENLSASDNAIILEQAGDSKFPLKKLSGRIAPREIELKGEYNGKPVEMKLVRMEIVSPTMGEKPPAGATVLFDGRDASQWTLADGSALDWEIKDGAMIIRNDARGADGKRKYSTAITKMKFCRCRLHLEFKVPAVYDDSRNGRGNSGVFFGNLYEIQILDSFGQPAFWDECASVYRQAAPYVNACLESGAWQTLDIEYFPPEFSADGSMKLYPSFSVWLNGVMVQNQTPVKYCTLLSPRNGADFKDFERAPIDISLQDHNAAVSFRNIWVLESAKSTE